MKKIKKRSSTIKVNDNFCGCGGSMQGMVDAGQKHTIEVEPQVCLNHWKKAIETHATNFPNAIHECTDISACEPTRYPSATIHISSPECPKHGNARGKQRASSQLDLYNRNILDPSDERSRATMWDVPRFAEAHDYEIVITENVTEVRHWRLFDSWLMVMHNLGYQHKCVYANSMFFHPTPQSRDRIYIVFWKKNNKAPDLEYRPKAYCSFCEKDIEAIQTFKDPSKKFGKYKQQYVYCCGYCASIVKPYYYAAFNCIDWSDLGNQVGDKYVENTRRRIQYGLDKLDHMPFYIQHEHSKILTNVKNLNQYFPTQATRQTLGIVTPMPFIIDGNFDAKPSRVVQLNQAMNTRNTMQKDGIVFPFIVENKGTSNAKQSTQPLGCLTAVQYHGIVTDEAFKSFITAYHQTPGAKHFLEPIGTQTCVSGGALVSYKKPIISECYYRMIKHHEAKKGMAFRENYIVLGNPKEQFKQLGNAVTPPVIKWIGEQCIETLL